jgi:hypothetical protein
MRRESAAQAAHQALIGFGGGKHTEVLLSLTRKCRTERNAAAIVPNRQCRQTVFSLEMLFPLRSRLRGYSIVADRPSPGVLIGAPNCNFGGFLRSRKKRRV